MLQICPCLTWKQTQNSRLSTIIQYYTTTTLLYAKTVDIFLTSVMFLPPIKSTIFAYKVSNQSHNYNKEKQFYLYNPFSQCVSKAFTKHHYNNKTEGFSLPPKCTSQQETSTALFEMHLTVIKINS